MLVNTAVAERQTMAHEQTGPSVGEHTAGTDTPIYDGLVRTVAGFTAPPTTADEPDEAPGGSHNARQDHLR
jgi:hypothetical protein